MNFPLERDQVVLPETAANLWASRRQANDFFAASSSFELGGIIKPLMASPEGNSEFCFPYFSHSSPYKLLAGLRLVYLWFKLWLIVERFEKAQILARTFPPNMFWFSILCFYLINIVASKAGFTAAILSGASVSKRDLLQNLPHEMSLICIKMNLKTKKILIWMVLYGDSLWHRGKRRLKTNWMGTHCYFSAFINAHSKYNNNKIHASRFAVL